MKILMLYILGLAAAWAGINSFLFALAHWEHDGSLLPALAGLLGILLSFRFFLSLIRLYLPSKDRHRAYLD